MKNVKQINLTLKKDFEYLGKDELLDLSTKLYKIQVIEKLNYNKLSDYEKGWEVYEDLYPEAFLDDDDCYDSNGDLLVLDLRDYFFEFEVEYNNNDLEVLSECDFAKDFNEALFKTELYIEEYKEEDENIKLVRVYKITDLTTEKEIKRKKIETLN